MSLRDDIRNARNLVYLQAKAAGVNMDAERSKTGSNQQVLTFEATKLLNDGVPRSDREHLVVDDPPAIGTFDGGNTAFTLSESVKGLNVTVVWGSTAENTTHALTRTNANPPGNHSFFFDPADPLNIIVGNAPLASDKLIVTYLVER